MGRERDRTRRAQLMLLCLLGASAADAEDRLVPGVPIDAALTAAGPRVFLADVKAGSALHLRLDHLNLDLVVRVLAPDGEVLGEASPFGTSEPVTLTVIAPRTGAQRVEARLRSPKSPGGRFRIRVDPPKVATEADRRRIRAERKRFEADRLGDVDEAAGFPKMFELYNQSINDFAALGDEFEQATALMLMGDMLEQVNRLQDAQEALERALPLFRAAGERGGESRCLDELALVHTERGETHTALELYAQALALRRALGPHPYSEGRIINGMAIAYANLGDTVRAIDRYTEALPFAREAGDETAYAVALKNRGGQYLDLGDTERGMQDLEDARTRFRALGKPREEGLAEFAIGTGWQNEKRYDEALQSFQRALPLLQKAGNERFVALVLNHMGLVRLAQGHPGEATTLLADALHRLEAGGDRRNAATIRVNQARVLTATGRFDEARAALLALCSGIREQFGDRFHEGNCNQYLAEAELGGGHLPEALAHAQASIRAIEETRGTIQASAQRSAWVAAGHPRYELLGAVLVALNAREPGKGWAAAALEASESARARSLLEVLSAARVDVQSGVDPSLLAAGKRLDERAERARRTLRSVLGREHKPEEADKVERELEALKVEREALQQKMRASSARYAALVPAAPLSLAEIREKVLDDSTTLLEYLVGEKRSFVFAVSRSRVDAAVLPGRETLQRAVTAVIRRWSDPGAPDDAAGPAAALSRMILGPVARGLEGSTLLVVADGPLQQLPFAALPAPGGGGAILDRFTLVSSPSASVLAALRSGREAPRGDGLALAILADPVVEGRPLEVGPTGPELATLMRALEDAGLQRLEPLPGSRQEARQIASYLPPEQVLTAVGADASRETALGPDVARARIVHFATHALLDVRRPELSGIVVSERDAAGRPHNGFLSLADVSSMRLSAGLVVLSACRTGLGKDVRGEGLVGLTRGFMNAGAPRVLASLWKVSDTATASLMSRFYRELLEGRRSPAEALRHAQRAMRQERRTSAPHAWAGFVLEGDWRPLDAGGAATAR
jgi:CHAT domain-containing protein/tetratricopeptide (TPR) repeat protein